jgi:short-subunit dehydrogenase
MTTLTGTTALVTGASGGIGAAIARDLARRGADLVLTARSEAPMRRLADDLATGCGVRVAVEPADLARPGAVADLVGRLDARGLAPRIVVANAGFGLAGDFVAQDAERIAAMLQVNIASLTDLAHLYARRFAAAGDGYLLLVASLAACQPDPGLAAYGASKAYVLALGEALHVELAPKGVGVTVLSPGLVDTGFNAVADYHPPAAARVSVLPAERVARIGVEALLARRASVVAGGLNRVAAVLSRLTPRLLSARMIYGSRGGG